MWFGMPWWKFQQKRQKKLEEELERRRAIELREERERKEKREERDIKVQREYAEAGVTGAGAKASKIRKMCASLRRKKRAAKLDLMAERERAEDTIADREAKPEVPGAEIEYEHGQRPTLGLGMKN